MKEIIKDWLPVKEFCKQHSNLVTRSQLRDWKHRAKDTNAFYFMRKMGRLNVISPSLFFEWIENNKLKGDKNEKITNS